MYVDFSVAGDEYKLRLPMRSIVALERQMGRNPIMLFANDKELPKVTDLALILHASMQDMHHGMTLDKVYDVMEAYMAEGNTPTDLIPTIVEVFKVSGLLGGDEKN